MSIAVDNRTAADIRSDVMDELVFDPAVTVRDLSVAADPYGVVTLYGTTDSFGMRAAAQEAAWRVWGVTGVVNDIRVDPTVLAQPLDDEIAADLRERLNKDFLVPKGRISFTVAGGVVTLRGVVNWHFQREAAREEAEDTWGVRSVINEIEIDPSYATPKQIDADIQKALTRNAQIDAQNITVTANGGQVTLSGTARSFAERREAEDAAWRAQGITDVTNNITVQPI